MTTANKSQKVFVEPDEEIVFTLGKINDNKSDRIILVVPQNAALVSSVVSLKMLSRRLLDGNKLVVLVTESENGQRLAEKANLVGVGKISKVNKDAWYQARDLKEALISQRDRIKSELLGDRQEEKGNEPKEQRKGKEVNVSDKKVKAKIEDDDQAGGDTSSVRPRLEEKAVEVGGITILAGGDINKYEDVLKRVRVKLGHEPNADAYFKESPKLAQADFKNQTKNIDSLRESAILAGDDMGEEISEKKAKKSFIGRDLTKLMPGKGRDKGSSRSRDKKKKGAGAFGSVQAALGRFFEGGGNKRLIQGFIVVVVLFFIISYLFFPAVSITLVFSENEVRVNEVITAFSKQEEIDIETLTIPANLISKTATISKDGIATGKKNGGDKAHGVLDIQNLQDEEITLPAGTLVTNIGTGLNYILTSEVTIPALGNATELAITAEKPGENYNIIRDSVLNFKVQNYEFTKVIGKLFYDITGGTNKEVAVVSKQDVESAKADAEDELKAQLLDSLNSLISDEEILIDGSEKFTEDEFKTSVKANEEADNFTIDLKLEITALSIIKSDLTAIAEELVKQQDESTQNGSISIGEPKLTDIEIINKKKVNFQLSSRADVTADIKEEDLIGQLAGLSVGEAREILRDLPGVSEYRLKYSPSYIPFFLQRVPTDQNKIELVKTFEGAEE
ncbi:MAG: baseplate J/gp47 family protein [Candidatus Dojkabacteria bacterium]